MYSIIMNILILDKLSIKTNIKIIYVTNDWIELLQTDIYLLLRI